MSSIFERVGRIRRHLASLDSGPSLLERIESTRQLFDQTQRILTDGATYGDLGYSRTLAVWYARLELPSSASQEEVTRSFRRLIRLYHPDLYASAPEMAETANELTQLLVAAHNGLLQHLSGGAPSVHSKG